MPPYRQIGYRIVVDDSGRLQVEKFEKGVAGSSKKIARSGKVVEDAWKRAKHVLSAGWGGIRSTIAGVGRGFGSIFRAMTSLRSLLISGVLSYGIYRLGKAFLSTASDMEKYETQLRTVLGTMDAAKSYMEWITRFAAGTPFEIPQLVETAILLESVGIKGQETMRIIGDTAGAMGRGIEEVGIALISMEREVLRRYGIDLRREGDKATFIWKDVKGQMVETTAKGSDAIIRETLLSIWNEKYAGGMELMSKTWMGMTSNLADMWTQFKDKVMKAGVFDVLKKGLGDVLAWIDRLAATGKLDVIASKVANVILRFIRDGSELLLQAAKYASALINLIMQVVDVARRAITSLQLMYGTLKEKTIATAIQAQISTLDQLYETYPKKYLKAHELVKEGIILNREEWAKLDPITQQIYGRIVALNDMYENLYETSSWITDTEQSHLRISEAYESIQKTINELMDQGLLKMDEGVKKLKDQLDLLIKQNQELGKRGAMAGMGAPAVAGMPAYEAPVIYPQPELFPEKEFQYRYKPPEELIIEPFKGAYGPGFGEGGLIPGTQPMGGLLPLAGILPPGQIEELGMVKEKFQELFEVMQPVDNLLMNLFAHWNELSEAQRSNVKQATVTKIAFQAMGNAAAMAADAFIQMAIAGDLSGKALARAVLESISAVLRGLTTEFIVKGFAALAEYYASAAFGAPNPMFKQAAAFYFKAAALAGVGAIATGVAAASIGRGEEGYGGGGGFGGGAYRGTEERRVTTPTREEEEVVQPIYHIYIQGTVLGGDPDQVARDIQRALEKADGDKR